MAGLWNPEGRVQEPHRPGYVAPMAGLCSPDCRVLEPHRPGSDPGPPGK
jgi:hypothetical protein